LSTFLVTFSRGSRRNERDADVISCFRALKDKTRLHGSVQRKDNTCWGSTTPYVNKFSRTLHTIRLGKENRR
jgi:hypothetical protein